MALIDHGKLDVVDTPDALIASLGAFAVDVTSEETLKSSYFHQRDEAIAFLSEAGEGAAFRNTTLEDVFVARVGRSLEKK